MKLVLALGALTLLGACQISGPPPPAFSPPAASTPPRAQPPQPAPPVGAPPRFSPANPGPDSPGSQPPAGPPDLAGDTCGAGRLQHLVGGPLPQRFPVAGPVRIFATGDPVTMDFNPQRVNVEVERQNRRRIVAITCG